METSYINYFVIMLLLFPTNSVIVEEKTAVMILFAEISSHVSDERFTESMSDLLSNCMCDFISTDRYN